MARTFMMHPIRRGIPTMAVVAVLGLPAFAAPAAADWIVTRDGARIETRGPWKVQGRQVIFDLPNGTLSAIRADEVDLDRSAAVTAEARSAETAPAAAEPPKREPVMRLTEKDIPPSNVAVEEAEAAAEGTPVEVAQLEVISWEKTETGDGAGLEIFGTIRNNGTNMITSPSLLAAIYDSDGGLLATNSGVVNSPQIAAGKTANFRVAFTGISDFASVRFDAQGRGFNQRPANATEADEQEEVYDEAPADVEMEPPPSDNEPPYAG